MADSEVENTAPQDSISVGDNQSTFTGSTVTGFTSAAARRKIINVETSTLFQLRSEVAQKAGEVTEIKNKLGVFKAPVVRFLAFLLFYIGIFSAENCCLKN